MLWRKLIDFGNTHYEGARYPHVLHVYQDALSLAQADLGQWQSEELGFDSDRDVLSGLAKVVEFAELVGGTSDQRAILPAERHKIG